MSHLDVRDRDKFKAKSNSFLSELRCEVSLVAYTTTVLINKAMFVTQRGGFGFNNYNHRDFMLCCVNYYLGKTFESLITPKWDILHKNEKEPMEFYKTTLKITIRYRRFKKNSGLGKENNFKATMTLKRLSFLRRMCISPESIFHGIVSIS